MFTESAQLLMAIIIITALSLLLIFTSVLLISTHTHIKKICDKFDSLSMSMYLINKKIESDNELNNTSFTEIKKALTIINTNIGSLSSGIEEFKKDIKEKNKQTFRLPLPEESKAMRETILENINVEVLLSKNLRIASKDSTRKIIDATMEAYPDIYPEYTIKLCLAVIENFLETI